MDILVDLGNPNMPKYNSESNRQKTLTHLYWDKNTFDSKRGTIESHKHNNDTTTTTIPATTTIIPATIPAAITT